MRHELIPLAGIKLLISDLRKLILALFQRRQVQRVFSRLATPWWAEANVVIGFIFFFCEWVFEITIYGSFDVFWVVGFLTPVLYVRPKCFSVANTGF